MSRYANWIAALLCLGLFVLFSSGLVVPLHEGGWIQAYLSIPATGFSLLLNLPLGSFIWLVTRGQEPFKGLRYAGVAVGAVTVLGLLILFLLLY